MNLYLTDTWPILGRYLTDTWQILDRHLTDTWPILDRSSTDPRPILDRYLTDTWPAVDRYISADGRSIYRLIIGRPIYRSTVARYVDRVHLWYTWSDISTSWQWTRARLTSNYTDGQINFLSVSKTINCRRTQLHETRGTNSRYIYSHTCTVTTYQ